jgi:hypothetical protein
MTPWLDNTEGRRGLLEHRTHGSARTMRLGSAAGKSLAAGRAVSRRADPIKAASRPFVNTDLVHLGEKFDQR